MKKIYALTLFVFISLASFAQSVVINKVFNSGLTGGNEDAIELIVVGTHPLAPVDLRGMLVKNYTSNGTVDGGCYTFTTNALWSSVKSGTIIVLRRNVTSTDTDISAATDFNLAVNLDDPTYFTAGTVTMNIASVDMVMLKAAGSAYAGEAGSIHAVSFGNSSATTQFNNVTGPKMRSTATVGTGAIGIAQNFNGSLVDYSNTAGFVVIASLSTDISSGNIVLGSPSVLASGNSRNRRFVNILRPSVVIESVYNSGQANGIGDVIKLKVLSANALDMRGMFIKDLRTNGTESNIYYKFSDATGSIWESVPSGTVITLTRAVSGTSADVNSADLTLDVLLANTAPVGNVEFNSSNTDATNFLDIDENDMLVIQPVADNNLSLTGESIITHAMAFGSVFSTVGSKYDLIGFGPKVGIASTLVTDARIAVQNTTSPINYYNSNLAITLNVLPVELITFTAEKQFNSVNLKWSTLTESNNARYDIYRAANGTDFIKITSINGAGTSSNVLNYSYIDNNPLAGDNYYKLVQVDRDGTEKVLKVIVFENSIRAFNAYVNNNNLFINAISSKNQRAAILLSNLSGQVVYNQAVVLQKGDNAFALELKNNASFYILKVQFDDDVIVKKLASSTF
ncbi:hypothetical protein [Pedobacter glucosidilyticus]|uniref:hypothetical protein n=1 Tax=Pedobacter glucosidilyticus TaxID=1122941 RepID=UPI0004134D44|nr:hypothetical protein [Pedobacter glucosidilyticus]